MRTHRTPRRVTTLALGATLLALVTAAPAGADDAGLPTVTPTSETLPLYDDEAGGNSDADDPAIWRNAADPDRSLVIATAKEGG
ncbi:phytase, partial [Streptomyces pharetrae]